MSCCASSFAQLSSSEPACFRLAENSILAIDRYVHDMPASLDTVIENFSDQSHVPWAHHGVAGDRHALVTNSASNRERHVI